MLGEFVEDNLVNNFFQLFVEKNERSSQKSLSRNDWAGVVKKTTYVIIGSLWHLLFSLSPKLEQRDFVSVVKTAFWVSRTTFWRKFLKKFTVFWTISEKISFFRWKSPFLTVKENGLIETLSWRKTTLKVFSDHKWDVFGWCSQACHLCVQKNFFVKVFKTVLILFLQKFSKMILNFLYYSQNWIQRVS